MKGYLLLIVVGLTHAANTNVNNSEGTVTKTKICDEEILLKDVESPYQLAIDYNTDNLYFSYSVVINGKTNLKLGRLNLKTKEFHTITDIKEGFASTIDGKSHTVYLGGADGLYTLNTDLRSATNLGVTNKSIWQLFSKDAIYFTTYPDEKAYRYKDGNISPVNEIGDTKAMLIAIDNSNNIVFANSSGLFCYDKNKVSLVTEEYVLNGLTKDFNGKLFFTTPTGVYAIEEGNVIKNVVKKMDVYGAAIARDGAIVYSSEDSIIRIKSSDKNCVISSEE